MPKTDVDAYDTFVHIAIKHPQWITTGFTALCDIFGEPNQRGSILYVDKDIVDVPPSCLKCIGCSFQSARTLPRP